MVKSWVVTSVINLFISGLLGFLLRISQLYNFEFPYGNFLHAHSHIAILGWLYLSFFTLIYSRFIPKNRKNKASYTITFWITQFSVIGMMCSFPIQGYAFFSIAFSTLHVFCSYYFYLITWKNISSFSSPDILFLKTSLVLMFISTLGIWAIPFVGKNSFLYPIAIQFFLHFQINGWFLFALFALLLNKVSSYFPVVSGKIRLFYLLTLLFSILTFAFPLNWYIPSTGLHIANSLGVLLQGVALFLFFKYIHPWAFRLFTSGASVTKYLYTIFTLLYSLKVIFQLFLVSPDIAEASHSIRNLTVGFIHLIVLGVYTILLFTFISKEKSVLNPNNQNVYIGILIFTGTFIFSESLLFIQGALIYFNMSPIPFYIPLLSWSSIGYSLGVFLLLRGILQFRKNKDKLI